MLDNLNPLCYNKGTKEKGENKMWDFADVITVIYLSLRIIFRLACVLFILWCAVSYADVLAHNLSSGEIASWNFFNVFIN